MLLQITHITTYRYAPQVNTAQHMAHLMPRATAMQEVLLSELDIDPQPATRRDAVDIRSFDDLIAVAANFRPQIIHGNEEDVVLCG